LNQRTLWDYADEKDEQREHATEADGLAEREERQRVRRRTIKRLRATGHWLTLLRVARSMPQPFTLNDISVAVWKACPEFFGMKGYPYPDNHRVHYILYGSRGLIAKGIIQRVRQGLFRVPEGVDAEGLFLSDSGASSEASDSCL
jgi:hypothetical protein